MHGPLSASLNDTPASIAEARQGNRRSLRSLRVLKVLCVTVPLVIFTAFAAYRHHQIHREAEIRLDRALRVAHEHALRVLDTNETMLGHIVELVQGNDDAALRSRHDALQTQLGNLIRNKPQIRAVWIIDAQGRPLLSTAIRPGRRTSICRTARPFSGTSEMAADSTSASSRPGGRPMSVFST